MLFWKRSQKKRPLKFLYSEKATRFGKISTVDLTGTTQDKSTVKISQNFVAFSEYMNFNPDLHSTEFHIRTIWIAVCIIVAILVIFNPNLVATNLKAVCLLKRLVLKQGVDT